ncbi:hypothetical protein BDV11DRAFT_173604 [Aspergillus similis]
MARTVVRLRLRPAAGSRPSDLSNKILQSREQIAYEQRFQCEIGNSRISAEQVDESTVVLLTDGFSGALDPDTDGPPERYMDGNHMCNLGSGMEEHRAWKTTRVYEIIGNHPRLVRFIARDPWTALPILEKPWSTLEGFLERYNAMYAPRGECGSRSYLKPPYRPLIFQWALQVLTALSFIHSKDVIIGDLHTHVCWLQSPDSICILGFLDAVYMEPMYAMRFTNDTWGREYSFPFHPSLITGEGNGPGGRWDRDRATVQTDLFLWAGLLYELLTGAWPAKGRGLEEVRAMLTNKLWPRLGEEKLDRIVTKCREHGYGSADEVKADLGRVLAAEGLVLGGVEGNEIQGLDVAQILAG